MSSNSLAVVYADDPDAHATYPITDAQGGALDFEAVVVVGGASNVTAEWEGETTTANGKTTRDLRVPLVGLTRGTYHLRLKVPGDNDVRIGSVLVR